MVNLINTWAQGIIVSVIIATIIEIILPETGTKKYVKVVLGVYILFSITNPIVKVITKKNFDANFAISDSNNKFKNYELSSVAVQTNGYIETTYKNNLKEAICKDLEKKGYKVLNLNIYIENENEERYGQINSLVMNIGALEKKEIKSNIEEININISNENINVKEVISETEIETLKDYFNNSYSVEKERIHINE